MMSGTSNAVGPETYFSVLLMHVGESGLDFYPAFASNLCWTKVSAGQNYLVYVSCHLEVKLRRYENLA